MQHYQVGDVVMIRPDLKDYGTYVFRCPLNDSGFMYPFCGKRAVITECFDTSYRIDIDNGQWFWSEDTLLPTGTDRDLELANRHIIFGENYRCVKAIFLPAVHLIPDAALRGRILHDLRKAGRTV